MIKKIFNFLMCLSIAAYKSRTQSGNSPWDNTDPFFFGVIIAVNLFLILLVINWIIYYPVATMSCVAAAFGIRYFTKFMVKYIENNKDLS